MDDIQDGWLEQTQKDIIDVFEDTETPLTAVIIGKNYGWADSEKTIPQRTNMVNAIQGYLASAADEDSNWEFEIGCHGWNHSDFTRNDFNQQRFDLARSRNHTVSLHQQYVSESEFITFVPPLNAFDDDTIAAAKETGYSVFSAGTGQMDANHRPIPGTNSSFGEFPMQAATTDLSDVYKISAEETMQLVQQQMSDYGFSVIMMHFVEFSMGSVTNQTAIDDLRHLIQLVNAAGYKVVTLAEMSNCWFGNCSNTTTPHPTNSTTTTTTTTTGRVTTGIKTSTTSTGSTPAPASTTSTGQTAPVSTTSTGQTAPVSTTSTGQTAPVSTTSTTGDVAISTSTSATTAAAVIDLTTTSNSNGTVTGGGDSPIEENSGRTLHVVAALSILAALLA